MSDTFLGERVPPGRVRRRAFIVGTLVAMAGLATALVILPLHLSRALENGPRWLAANDLLLDIAILVFAVGAAFMGLAQRRGAFLWLAVIGIPLVVVTALALPAAARDAFGPLEQRSLDIVEWTVESNGTGVVRTGSGETYRWAEAFGVIKYPPMAAGRYDVLLTAAGQRIVRATRAD